VVARCNSFAGHLSFEPDDVGNASVRGWHDAQWQEVLCRHDRHRVPVAPAYRRPLFFAIVQRAGSVDITDDTRQGSDRQRQGQCRSPDDDERADELTTGKSCSQRVTDRPVTVNADSDQREGGKKHGNRLRVADQRAQSAAERPVLKKHVRDERERHTDGRHQHVGTRQIHDEPIGHCPHPLLDDDDWYDKRVATDRDDDNSQVESDQDHMRVDWQQVRADDKRRVTVRRRPRVVLSIHDYCQLFDHLMTEIIIGSDQ